MKTKIKEREFQIWGMLSMTIILVWIIVIWMLIDSKNSNEKAFLDVELKRFEGEVHSTLITYEAFSNYIYDEISDDDEIIWIMDQANSATNKEKEHLRQQLYDKLDNKYLRMKKYKFRQLHFHLPNTESFLRVHTPDKYGDLLYDVRESVRLANENKESIIGFEEGRIFNGFRHVYPLKYDDLHIGTVELSISSASIIEVLSELYREEDFHFIIDKSIVEENVFNEELSNYKDSIIFEDYYVDKEVDVITTAYNTVIPDQEGDFFKGVKEKYCKMIKDKESFAAIYKFQGEDYILKFSSIKNLKEIPVAYLISISKSFGYKQFTKDSYEEIILVTFLAFFIIIFGLVLAFYQHKLKDSSELDYLTKIYNRNKFYELVNKEARSSKRYKYDSSIMLMDIDYFKNVNDTYGHEWGDQVLKEVASLISKNIRDVDIFARWGGEEFVIMLPHTDKVCAEKVAEKLRILIEQSKTEKLRNITISIGVSSIDSENYDVDNAIKSADEAMYCAKRNGRNQVCSK